MEAANYHQLNAYCVCITSAALLICVHNVYLYTRTPGIQLSLFSKSQFNFRQSVKDERTDHWIMYVFK